MRTRVKLLWHLINVVTEWLWAKQNYSRSCSIWKRIIKIVTWLFFSCHYILLSYKASLTVILFIVKYSRDLEIQLSLLCQKTQSVHLGGVLGLNTEAWFFRRQAGVPALDPVVFLPACRMDDAEACFILSSRCEVDRTSSVSVPISASHCFLVTSPELWTILVTLHLSALNTGDGKISPKGSECLETIFAVLYVQWAQKAVSTKVFWSSLY